MLIKSLLNQDFKGNLEIIVVDDGSTDNSLDILNRYAELSPERLKVLHKENGGQSSARNLAMECARGEYISFVDSDDYVEPGFISNLYNLAVSSDADIAMCSSNRCMEDDGKGKRFDSGFTKDFVTEDIDWVLMHSSFAPWNKIYKRTLWDGITYPEGMTYEDFATIPQVIFRASRIAYTHNVLYHYRINQSSTIMKMKGNTDLNIIRAQDVLEKSELKSRPDLLENYYLRRVLNGMCYSLVLHRDDGDLLKDVVIRAKQTYPKIGENELIAQFSSYSKLFLKLFSPKSGEQSIFLFIFMKEYGQ